MVVKRIYLNDRVIFLNRLVYFCEVLATAKYHTIQQNLTGFDFGKIPISSIVITRRQVSALNTKYG